MTLRRDRLYYTYIYATPAGAAANDVIEQMEVFYKVAEEIWKTGIQDAKIRVNQFTLYNLRNRITEVKLSRSGPRPGRSRPSTPSRRRWGSRSR